MTPALLRRCGEALYGERWQSALAAALGVSDRTVRRWLSGADRPRPAVWRDLRAVLATRVGTLHRRVVELDDALRALPDDPAQPSPNPTSGGRQSSRS